MGISDWSVWVLYNIDVKYCWCKAIESNIYS